MVDRPAFEAVLDNNLTVPSELSDARLVLAHGFFQKAIGTWAGWNFNAAGTSEARMAAVSKVLQQGLQIVAIDLSGTDDDQLH